MMIMQILLGTFSHSTYLFVIGIPFPLGSGGFLPRKFSVNRRPMSCANAQTILAVQSSRAQHAVQHSSFDPCWPINPGRMLIDTSSKRCWNILNVSKRFHGIPASCNVPVGMNQSSVYFAARTHAILTMCPLATRDAAWMFGSHICYHDKQHCKTCYMQCSST